MGSIKLNRKIGWGTHSTDKKYIWIKNKGARLSYKLRIKNRWV